MADTILEARTIACKYLTFSALFDLCKEVASQLLSSPGQTAKFLIQIVVRSKA